MPGVYMPLNKLRRAFEERKASLVEQLKRNKNELDLSQQHQIYGAIKEIDNFLKTIDHYRTLEAQQAFDMDLSQEKESPFIKRTQRVVKKLGNDLREVVTWTFVIMPVKVGKKLKGTYEERRERREFYKHAREEYERKKKDGK